MSIATKAAKARSTGMAGRVQAGDPGIFGGIIGGITGLLTGGPGGAIAGAVAGARGTPRPSATANRMTVPMGPGRPPLPVPARGAPGLATRAGQALIPGGRSGLEAYGPPPAGYRLNKTGYWLKSGQYVAPGTKYVKSRRRNPLNPRALSRAMARLTSAKRASKAIGRISIRSK